MTKGSVALGDTELVGRQGDEGLIGLGIVGHGSDVVGRLP